MTKRLKHREKEAEFWTGEMKEGFTEELASQFNGEE